jgi:hypothetical protein
MNSSDPKPDPLDDLLASARWPEAEAERLSRLQAHWDSSPLRTRSHARQVAIRCAAVAAALALSVVVAWWSWTEDRPGDIQHPPHKIVEHAPPRQPVPVPHETRKPAVAVLKHSRPATLLETAAFKAHQSRQHEVAWQQDTLVEQAIAAIRYTPDLSAQQIATAARPLLARRAYNERRLLESATYFDGSRRDAALRLLAHVATPRSLSALLPLVEHPHCGRLAASTLLHVVPPESLAILARRERNPQGQQAMLAALLKTGDRRTVGLFLTCVAHRQTRAAALQVAAHTDSLPIVPLVDWLNSSDPTRSSAAATALAHATDPAAVSAMIALARSGRSPQAAMIALVGSEQPAAQSFVAAAQKSPLVAAVNEAQFRWRSLTSADVPNL